MHTIGVKYLLHTKKSVPLITLNKSANLFLKQGGSSERL